MSKVSFTKNLHKNDENTDSSLPSWEKARDAFTKKNQNKEESPRLESIVNTALKQTKPHNEAKSQEVEKFSCLPNGVTYYSGYPTDMTRCNPFFPVNPNSVGASTSQYLQEFMIHSGAWGTLTFSGPKLTVYDEDVLIAILALLYEKENHPLLQVIKDKKSGTEALTYTGSALKILKRMGRTNPGQNDYKRLQSTLVRLQSATLKFNISLGKSQTGEKRSKSYITNILVGVTEYEETERNLLNFTISPFFYNAFLKGAVTMLNATTRLKLRSPTARVLYRFVMSQKNDVAYKGSFKLLSQALNIEQEQPDWSIRRLLKEAIATLIKNNILSKSSKFIDKNIIILVKAPSAEKTSSKRRLSIDFSNDKPIEIELGSIQSLDLPFLNKLK